MHQLPHHTSPLVDDGRAEIKLTISARLRALALLNASLDIDDDLSVENLSSVATS